VRALYSRRDGAFTLLEVMAAVLVLGMLYAVLATAAIRGLRSEGESKRRIEASLLADHWLSDLEIQLALGQVPEKGAQQEEIESYVVSTNVTPFDPTAMMEVGADFLKKRGVNRRASSRPTQSNTQTDPTQQIPGAEATPTAPDPALAGQSLLAPPRAGQDGRLRRIDVVVSWYEGEEEQQVTRTTFGFDTTGLEELFPKKQAGGGGDEEGEGGQDEIQKMLEQLGGGGGGEQAPEPSEP
jgi:type II secretory pathway pseudopilin PulG